MLMAVAMGKDIRDADEDENGGRNGNYILDNQCKSYRANACIK